MSNLEGENPEFEDFDLSEGDLSQPEGTPGKPEEPEEETLLFEGAGDMLDPGDDMLEPGDDMLQPSDDMLQPGEEAADAGLVDELGMPTDEEPELAEAEGLAELGAGEPVGAEEEAEEEPEEEEKEPGFFEKLAQTSPYVVLLGISAAAIMIAILYLFLELREYGFQVKPTQATHRWDMEDAPPSHRWDTEMPHRMGRRAPAVQSGPPSTTATA